VKRDDINTLDKHTRSGGAILPALM
jgi:hypothetical protein